MSKKLKRALLVLPACLVAVGLLASAVSAQNYPRLQNRSLTIGTSAPGATTDWRLSWRFPSNTSVGSIRLLVCADPYVLDACSSTPDADLSAATLASQTGPLGGFSIASQTTDEIILSRPSAGASGTGQYVYSLDNVINPGGLHSRFFVQISTYTSTDASGVPHHRASVASATAEPIVINTVVPPILYFCAGLSISDWCEDVNGNFIDYGDFEPFVTDYATSQFGAATNALGGYVVTINGDTLTSGNKTITPIGALAANTPGIGQFGLNLRANTDPPGGADVVGAGIGVVHPDYDTPDMFLYRDGDIVASAATGSLFNTYTVTYVVNVDPDQPTGIYNTTIAYICTAAF